MAAGSSFARAVRVVLLVAACGVATLAWLRARDAAERADALAREVAALGKRIAAEATARDPVGRPIGASTGEAPVVAATPATPRTIVPEEPPAREPAREANTPGDDREEPFDVDRLVAAGFRREDVERFRARADEIDLARVYLRDRATREGWAGTPRFREESAALDAEQAGLRGEFDESLYDWMLYASGQPNRVGVAEVLTGSAAETAGLAKGDVIVRYDERLMLNVQELLDATNAGRAGELVAVEVQREGRRDSVRVFIPRGPIGVRIAPTAVEPASRG